MQYEYDNFVKNLDIIEELHVIHGHLKDNLNYPNDLSDLLRTQITQFVSAFDKFMHDIVRKGMIQSYAGNRQKTPGYLKYSIDLGLLNDMMNGTQFPPEYILELDILKRHGYISFQDIGKIKEGLSLIWSEEHKWQKIAAKMAITERDLKTEFKNIVNRRNQIVHEFDFDLLTNQRRIISSSDTQRIKDFIRNLGKAIFEMVS